MTGIQYVPLPLRWEVLKLASDNGFSNDHVCASKIENRLHRILGEWEGTPFDMKFARKGKGVYCTAFVCHVLDELYRHEPTSMLTIPDDISFHNHDGAVAGLRWFMRKFPTCFRLTDTIIQPGDILITGPDGGGPGHAMIVGPQENTLWQSTGVSGVHYTGMALPEPFRLFAKFRFRDRESWL